MPHNNPEPFILSSRDWSKHGKVLDEQVPTEQREKTVSKTEGKRSTPEVSALSPGIRKRERQTLGVSYRNKVPILRKNEMNRTYKTSYMDRPNVSPRTCQSR